MSFEKNICKIIVSVLLSLMLAFAVVFGAACDMTGCEFIKNDPPATIPNDELDGIPDKPESEITKIADFTDGRSDKFNSADGYKNGDSFFGCYWSKDNVTFADGQMTLTLSGDSRRYYGGEYRSYAKYGHGYYSVSMKPLKMDGVISSFFTYTNRPWDEIDIEFLGDDTTKVQFNYYTSGVGGHEYVYHLGFDASEGFHTYGFEWLEDCIIWYVDGKAVHKATEDIPVTDAQIMMNLWNVNTSENESLKDWAGVFTGEGLPGSAHYKWIGFDPHIDDPISDNGTEDGTTGGTEGGTEDGTGDDATGGTDIPADSADGIAIADGIYQWGGNGRDHYTITPSNDKRSVRVSYDGLDSRYSGIGRDLDASIVGSNDTLTFKAENLADASSVIRADVGTKTSGALINKVISASYFDENGEHVLPMQNGYMSPITIGAGKTVTVRLVFDGDDINGMTISLDSLDDGYANAKGDLIFSAFDFSLTNGNGGSLADIPERPESSINKISDFSSEKSALAAFEKADGWSNGDMFGCTWSANNVNFSENKMILSLSKSGDTYYAGEYRSKAVYGHGYYSVSMKPLKKAGTISSFFTYTGPSDGTRWDEIDIEFLGDDTTKVQFNYYSDGEGGHEYVYDLGFDAGEEWHNYGFEWKEDCIIWYVDGKAVYKATKNIPVTNAKIMTNMWNVDTVERPDLSGWAGVFDGDTQGATAEYAWIGYNAAL